MSSMTCGGGVSVGATTRVAVAVRLGLGVAVGWGLGVAVGSGDWLTIVVRGDDATSGSTICVGPVLAVAVAGLGVQFRIAMPAAMPSMPRMMTLYAIHLAVVGLSADPIAPIIAYVNRASQRFALWGQTFPPSRHPLGESCEGAVYSDDSADREGSVVYQIVAELSRR